MTRSHHPAASSSSWVMTSTAVFCFFQFVVVEAGENGSTAEGGNGDQHEIQRGKHADSDQVGDREFVRVFQAVCHDEFLQK